MVPHVFLLVLKYVRTFDETASPQGIYTMSSLPLGCAKLCEHAYIDVLTRGDLSTLTWIGSHLENFDHKRDSSGHDLSRVAFASLNFRDVMLATGACFFCILLNNGALRVDELSR